MDTRNRILTHATNLFLKYGIKTVSLDRLVRDLGISKKTLYQLFANKSLLVQEVCQNIVNEEEGICDGIIEVSENAVDELVKYMQHSIHQFQRISPKMIYEVRKYYPDGWKIFERHSSEYGVLKVEENLIRGISEGLYRPEINVNIVSRMRVNSINTEFDPTLFPEDEFNLIEIHFQLFQIYLYGIATEKGRSLIETYLTHEFYQS
ncbi:MAG: TetR/AcrR family transcriptional regulator [Bacteroidota bacterium]